MNRRAVPFQFFWTGNCSIRADDFDALGGFDEDFEGWGGEDIEMGFRIFRRGVPFRVATEAWAIEVPHERDLEAHWAQFTANITLFLAKHPEPVVELGAVLISQWRFWDWDDEYRALETQWEPCRSLDVADEVADALRGIDQNSAIAVIGCGGHVPQNLPSSAVLMDFDRASLDAAVSASGGHEGHHAIGLRTPLSDQSVDVVLITSRMAGMWSKWSEELLAEARRIGRKVQVLADIEA
jgi:hypothetical protein